MGGGGGGGANNQFEKEQGEPCSKCGKPLEARVAHTEANQGMLSIFPSLPPPLPSLQHANFGSALTATSTPDGKFTAHSPLPSSLPPGRKFWKCFDCNLDFRWDDEEGGGGGGGGGGGYVDRAAFSSYQQLQQNEHQWPTMQDAAKVRLREGGREGGREGERV